MSLTISLNTAVYALLAQQRAVDTASHNIANATTAGYSRQRIHMAAVPGTQFFSGGLAPGGGVEVISIERVRDLFIDFQFRVGSHAAGQHSARAASLARAEMALGEPGDSGLRVAMSEFWNAWRDLSNGPEESAPRSTVVQAGQSLALVSRRISASLSALRREADTRIRGGIDEVNALATEIAGINGQVIALAVAGGDTGGLQDRRDLALDRLATLMDVSYRQREDGAVDVSIAGRALVSGTQARGIYGQPDPGNLGYVDLRFSADGAPLEVRDGELAGLIEQRDSDLPGRLADLDALIGQVIADVNTAHAAGFGLDGVGGRDFLTGTSASDIAVDAAMVADTSLIAASATAGGVPGDGDNANALSDLQYARTMAGGTATFDEHHEQLVTSLGAAARAATRRAESQQLVLEGIEMVRQSLSGVNLDEEIVELMRYQRAYEAAARLISVADSMLDTLINRMT